LERKQNPEHQNIKIRKKSRRADVDNLCQLFQSFNGEDCTISMLFHHTAAGTDIYFRIADVENLFHLQAPSMLCRIEQNGIFSAVICRGRH
jgi:hypothetical protein